MLFGGVFLAFYTVVPATQQMFYKCWVKLTTLNVLHCLAPVMPHSLAFLWPPDPTFLHLHLTSFIYLGCQSFVLGPLSPLLCILLSATSSILVILALTYMVMTPGALSPGLEMDPYFQEPTTHLHLEITPTQQVGLIVFLQVSLFLSQLMVPLSAQFV